ncbi:tryptophan transporter [Bacillus sp. FJAT-50079]|uniref:tryptophan transporter n=1 Tax=Bacillus sp. FJAT-50079 TaxID=2833577 RepID=UPI001BC9F499|nr:tryptophan transporter [Bacillus sp. FJAT-50079]MBS4210695.1 tryptophan transporter [Bacillus sp. FJAT-50079]
MNTRVLVVLSLLLGIGTALHFIMPAIMGVTPDMLLAMMFLGIVLFPEKKNVLLLGIATGLLSALTTGFPMGQIPNMIDKPITAFVFFGLFLIIRKIPHIAGLTILTAICTIVSGVLFLGSAAIFFELPGGATLLGLISVAVLPAALLNSVLIFIIYPVVKTVLKRTNLLEQAA